MVEIPQSLPLLNFNYYILEDDRMNKFFKDVDMKKQSIKMNVFLTYLFGGPSFYTGRNIRKAHKNVVANRLNDEHVDAMLDDVHKTLNEMEIGADLQK